MTNLPNLDALPNAFHIFLDDLKWPRGFKRHRSRRHSRLWYLLPSLITLLGILLGFYPTEARDVLTYLGQSFVADTLILLSFLVSGTALISALMPASYPVV